MSSPTFFRATAWLAVLAAGMTGASAQVVVSEIHYHPLEEAAFDGTASFNPVLDLSEDVHEFVEIHNSGSDAVDLGGWRLSGGIGYVFPPGTSIPAGGFKVVAKSVSRLQTVYGIGGVLGPYSGKLSNAGDTVRLRDAADATVDSVTYSSDFPWPSAADALGANDRFTGLSSSAFLYKGRSLQRVSSTASSNDPANWLASPLNPGPTPGAAQAVTREVPQPVVVALSRVQAHDSSAVILAGNAVTVSCGFSSADGLAGVQLEWFVDSIESTTETRTVVTMSGSGSGPYGATIPAQAARAMVRYRILATRGSGTETVSPRADDAIVSQVGAGGARQPWHGYFVQPSSGRSTTVPQYDLFLSTANLAQIRSNAQQGGSTSTATRRVTAASQSGLPRSLPWVAATAPQWNGTVPAVFACDGVLHDVHIRFHGSRYHRYENAAQLNSFKLHFPDKQPFRGRTSWFITEHGTEFAEATKMNRLLGLPASTTRTVSWYFNANAVESKLEQGEYDKEMLDAYHDLRQQLEPGSEREENGELYKVVGNRDASQNNSEGPYTKGDLAPMNANASWTQLQRCDWTFSLQNHAWKGPVPMRDMIAGMWAARGDSPTATTLAGNATRLAATRAWFLANFDVDTTLTSLALLQWLGIWDDAAHNQFYWRRANGKWVRLGWDYDRVMTTSGSGTGPSGNRVTQTIYAGEAGFNVFDGTNWWKDSFLKCFRTEFKQRLWELNNSFFDPANLSANGFTTAVTFANQRQANVNAQLGLGTYAKPARPVNASPAADGVVVGGAALVTSAYSSPNSRPHAATLWEIRGASGDYETPVFRSLSTTALTALPLPYEALVYGRSYWWRASHVDADGHPSVVSAETRFTWGAASVEPGALVLNEILAVNVAAVPHEGGHPDYIEIRNNGSTAYDLTGVTVTDDPALPARFTFPAGNTLAAGGRLVLWCDDSPGGGFHTGFALFSGGETLLLMKGGTLLDSVTFGPQAPDLAIGRAADGTGSWTACDPTPGLVNTPRALGSTATLSVNEWMAAPAYGDDWFELHNSGTAPVALGGLWLSDSAATPQVTRVPALSYIAAGGFTRFEADGGSTGGNRCAFKLATGGESIVLTAADGVTPLDRVDFAAQAADTSQGALPDGGAGLASFPLTASPASPNWLPTTVVVAEVLSRPAAGGSAFVELHNPSSAPLDIGGWWLGDDIRRPMTYRIPAGTVLPADGRWVAAVADLGLGSAARVGEVCLAAADGAGALTGYRSQVFFGPAEAGRSFGRVPASGLPNGSGGFTFVPLAAPSPGSANAQPWLKPVIITEVMYHPPDGDAGEDDSATEYVELYNPTGTALDLSGWRLKGGSDFSFAAGTVLPPSGYLLVVGFDPADAAARGHFLATYALDAATLIAGPFRPMLANNTQRIAIARPDDIAGFTAAVECDSLEYRDAAPWPTGPDGSGTSLQRIGRAGVGADAAHWGDAAPSPAAVNAELFTVLEVWTEMLPEGETGSPYDFQLTAVGGTAPRTWSLVSGSLPAGLSLTPDGAILGTPLSPVAATFTVQVAGGGVASGSFTLNVRGDASDADEDGMPDEWEATHGLEPDRDDAAEDADRDGQPNFDEYLAGTHPRDAASVFSITSVSAPAGGIVTVEWSAVAGKRYRIHRSPDLIGWTPAEEAVESPASGTLAAEVEAGPGPALFLRVEVEP
jgi:hypothetical protein